MIKIESVWLEHTMGTKFYQVFQIVPESGKSVTICHWGKASIAEGRMSIRPVLGGETQLHSGRIMSSKVRAKEKRDYHERDNQVWSVPEDSPWFVEHFGAELAHRIEVALFDVELAMGLNGDPVPKPAVKNKPIEKTPDEPRPESWGTW